jgi:tetratricopeptide (TPR) repeat protein
MGSPAVSSKGGCDDLLVQIPPNFSDIKRGYKAYVTGGLWFLLVSLACCSVSLAGSGDGYLPGITAFAQSQSDSFQEGLAALKENRFADALAALTAAEREHGDDAVIRNLRGIALGQLGRDEEAASEFQEALRLQPDFADAHRNLGFLLWTEHKLEAAQTALSRALEISPEDSFAHYYLGRVKLDARQYADGLKELQQFHEAWPTDAEFLLQVAAAYEELKQNSEALETLDKVSATSLNDLQAARAAQLLLEIHENDKALRVLKRRPWARFDVGLIELLSRNYQEAAKQAQEDLDWLHGNKLQGDLEAGAWSLLGIAQAQSGKGDEAAAALQRAANLDPRNEEGWLNLTRELMELKRHADALAAVQKGIAANPKSYALQLRLGAAYLAAGRYTEAENAFRALTTAGDPLPTSYVGLAQTLLREGRAVDAAYELAAAQQKIGQSFLLSYFMGLALERTGKRQEAIAAYREAVQLNPASSEAHLGVGKLELAAGRIVEATAELEEALRLSPGNAQARRLLSQAYQRAGNKERAEKYATTSGLDAPTPEGDLLSEFILPRWQSP